MPESVENIEEPQPQADSSMTSLDEIGEMYGNEIEQEEVSIDDLFEEEEFLEDRNFSK